MRTFLLFFTILSLYSCSYSLKILDKNQQNQYKVITKNKSNFCEPSKHQVYSDSQSSIKYYQSRIKNLDILPVEKFALFTLAQLFSTPHIFSPSSSFDIYIHNNNKWSFYNFNNESTTFKYPLLIGLIKILREYGSKKTLSQLASYIDQTVYEEIRIGEDVADYIKENKRLLEDQKGFKRYLMRGRDTLRSNESVRYPRLSTLLDILVRDIAKSKINPGVLNYLFPYEQNFLKSDVQCNFDIKLYEHSIYPVTSEIVKSAHFGIQFENFYAMASVGQRPTNKLILNSPFFQGEPTQKNSFLCFVGKNDKHQLAFISSNSRDPGQHLFHLLKYKIDEVKNIAQMHSLLKFSRHLFLYNPPRLLYESERGSKEQMNQLLKLDFPVYDISKIGKITALSKYGKKKYFTLDDRYSTKISCK